MNCLVLAQVLQQQLDRALASLSLAEDVASVQRQVQIEMAKRANKLNVRKVA